MSPWGGNFFWSLLNSFAADNILQDHLASHPGHHNHLKHSQDLHQKGRSTRRRSYPSIPPYPPQSPLRLLLHFDLLSLIRTSLSSVLQVVEGAQEGLEQGQEKAEGAMKQRYFSVCRSSFFFVKLALNFFFCRFGSVRSLIPNIVKLSRRSSRFLKIGFTPRSIQSTHYFLRSSPILLPNKISQKALPSFEPFSNASRVNRRARHRQFPKCDGRGIARFKVERVFRMWSKSIGGCAVSAFGRGQGEKKGLAGGRV